MYTHCAHAKVDGLNCFIRKVGAEPNAYGPTNVVLEQNSSFSITSNRLKNKHDGEQLSTDCL